MRIISGTYGGRHLKSLQGNTTRPTTDKVKESIFNIIGPYFDGGVCFDLYAGSGGLSIEAVSRGINHAYLFEKDRQAQQVILGNIDVTKERDKFTLLKGPNQRYLATINEKATLVFLDPPYQQQKIEQDIKTLLQLSLLEKEAIIVCETDKMIELPNSIHHVKKWKKALYGTIAVHFYRLESET